ncbi:MAG TPA: hypothetical protein VHE78_15175 [Gemmatimonadaceae bacterium]|nr:hypothetical protein [Gemmatimonadaceae bacterium]
MRPIVRYSLAAALCALVALPALPAQGSLSTQGFGYPGGQLSSRALGAGGSLADFDANSPLNPASLSLGVRAAVYAQYDPEFRRVTSPSGNASSTTARFPVVGVSGRFGRATVGLSFSSLLDRSWTNTYFDTQTVGGQLVQSRVTAQSAGGISDARAALSYQVSEKLYFGAGLHVFPGENRTVLGRDFADSLRLGSFTQASIYNFSGSAVSVGLLAIPVPHLNLAASARFGGSMHMHAGDSTVVGSATVPSRWSVSAAYEGFAGSALAVRYGKDKWTGMRGLGSPGLVIRDAAELAGGMEVAGPRVSGIPMALRLGFRSRDLPFAVGTQKVAEQSLTGGVGIPLAAGRGAADIALARARRTSAGLAETGWILSIGFAIKP